MFDLTTVMIDSYIEAIQTAYRHTYGSLRPDYCELLGQAASLTLQTIARTDALYHNLEHTMLVTLVGQEILLGKQVKEGNVSCQNWANFIVSLLCHDIGYLKGICRHDRPADHLYTTGLGDERVSLAPGATDASLTPYHVDRGKLFVEEMFADQPLLNLTLIKRNIELTRFPVPAAHPYQDTASYAGLARAADLIGQLSDPRYLEKIPALFYEFAEVGTHEALGYRHPGDLRAGYPNFFHKVVYPYIEEAMTYLEATPKGREILTQLWRNVAIVEQELFQAHQGRETDTAGEKRGQPPFSTPSGKFSAPLLLQTVNQFFLDRGSGRSLCYQL